jgi:hypothetical protein
MKSLHRAGLLLGAVALIGCTGSPDTDPPDDAPAAAQPVASASTAVPTAPGVPSSETPTTDAEPSDTVEATATAIPEPPTVTAAVSRDASSTACAPGDSIDVQKTKMLDILIAQFPGKTQKGRPRVQFGPDSRDHRQGGIWMVLEFNGDELETVTLKKAALNRQMRDAYEALFTAGCEDLAQADLASYQNALVKVSMMGETIPRPSIVFKTRLKRDIADSVVWADKESLDFDEIWDVLLLNPRWRDELRELEDGN